MKIVLEEDCKPKSKNELFLELVKINKNTETVTGYLPINLQVSIHLYKLQKVTIGAALIPLNQLMITF